MTDMRSRKKRAQDEAARKAAASYRATPGGARDMRSLGNFVTAMDSHRYDGMAEGTVMVTVSHSNLKQKHVDLRFDLHTTVGDVKARLSLHNGTNAGDMRLILRVDGQDVCALDDDDRPLGFYSVENGNVLHVIDTNPYSLSAGGGLEDTSLVKKYVMSDEEYNKRKNTLRAYKREQLKKDPNFKFDFRQGPGGAKGGESKANKENKTYPGPESVVGIDVGARCEVQPGARRGTVRYVGEVAGIAGGHWVGVVFDEPVGKSNGTVKGTQYFECMPRYGGFVRGGKVTAGDFPEMDLFDSDDSDDSDEEL